MVERGRIGVHEENIARFLVTQQVPSIQAGVKELVQNAVDIQTEAKNVEIFLYPDRILVYDDGIGMTKQQFKQHFATLGDSSKTYGIGRFGIGGKALVGHSDVEYIDVSTTSNGEAIRAKLFLEDNDPVYELDDVILTKPGTSVSVNLREPLNSWKLGSMGRNLLQDVFAVKPKVIVRENDKIGGQVGGVNSFQELATENQGVYIKNEHGEAVGFYNYNRRKKPFEDYYLHDSTYYTIHGFNIETERREIPETAVLVNLHKGRRIISSTKLIEEDKEAAEGLEELTLDKLAARVVAEEKAKDVREFLLPYLSMKASVHRTKEKTLDDLLHYLSPTVKEARIFDGFFPREVEPSKVSLEDITAMEKRNKGFVYSASRESGNRVDRILTNNGISYISDKELSKTLIDNLSFYGYKTHVVDTDTSLSDRDTYILEELKTSFLEDMSYSLKHPLIARRVVKTYFRRLLNEYDEKYGVSLRGQILGKVILPSLFPIMYPLLRRQSRKHAEFVESSSIKPEIYVKGVIKEVDDDTKTLLTESINTGAKDLGIKLPPLDVAGLYLHLPGLELEVPNPEIEAYYNDNKASIFLNLNNPSIQKLNRILMGSNEQAKRMAVYATLLTPIAHEKVHEDLGKHDTKFYEALDSLQYKIKDKILHSLEN